jgi:hypothetical protein
MKIHTKKQPGYQIGILWNANGHTLFLNNWPEEILDPERLEEPCSFCTTRGLKHGW